MKLDTIKVVLFFLLASCGYDKNRFIIVDFDVTFFSVKDSLIDGSCYSYQEGISTKKIGIVIKPITELISDGTNPKVPLSNDIPGCDGPMQKIISLNITLVKKDSIIDLNRFLYNDSAYVPYEFSNPSYMEFSYGKTFDSIQPNGEKYFKICSIDETFYGISDFIKFFNKVDSDELKYQKVSQPKYWFFNDEISNSLMDNDVIKCYLEMDDGKIITKEITIVK